MKNKERKNAKESNINLFNRYVWLCDLIYRHKKITLDEIKKHWEHSSLNPDGTEFPSRTFHNHKNAIEEMFDINISCDKKNDCKYFIEDRDDIEKNGVRQWLINTFALNNLINESHKIKHRILFEKIPGGQEFLTKIIEAMKNENVIELTYKSFWKNEKETFTVEPYCVKVFHQRWYLVARNCQKNALRNYALDRIEDLKDCSKTFKLPETFDPETYFENSFGVITDENEKPEEIRLKIYGKKVAYIRSLPLHKSQKLVEIGQDYEIYKYYLRPTYDFIQEISSHGYEVEVLSPKSLRDTIIDNAKKTLKLYEK